MCLSSIYYELHRLRKRDREWEGGKERETETAKLIKMKKCV